MVDEVTKDWIRNDSDARAAANGYRMDLKRGAHFVKFCELHLRNTVGRWAGEPLVLMEWQKSDIAMPLFGWVNSKTGHRRFRMAYIEVPKKNGKSTLCGAIALYLLAGEGEKGSEVYCAAADRKQAGIVYRAASEMAKASPLLRDYITPKDSTKHLAIVKANSYLEVISRDAFTAEGRNVHGLIFDELHTQKDRRLWDAMRYGGAIRDQPLLVSITTAGWDRHSICFEQHDYAEKVNDGIIEDESFFGYIKSASRDDDWTDPAVWRKANPSMGTVIKESEMAQACSEAKASPAKENGFKRYRLNIWTEQADRWIAMDKWDACKEEIDWTEFEGRTCFAALDLASVQDLNALVLLFLHDGRTYLKPWFWAPRDGAIERQRKDRVPYLQWAKEGHMTLTDNNVTDYDAMREDIIGIAAKYPFFNGNPENQPEIAVDVLFQGAQLCTQLQTHGFQPIVYRQGWMSMTAPSREFFRRILNRELAHDGNPVLRWMASNVAVLVDESDNMRPDKKRSYEKIDGIVASIMAMGRQMANGEEQGSVYDDPATCGVYVEGLA